MTPVSGRKKMVDQSRKLAVHVVRKPRSKRVPLMFSSEVLNQFVVSRNEVNFVEVRCGITSRYYGDYVGRIKIFRDGRLTVTCECFVGCTADKLSLSEFQKHTKPPPGKGSCRRSTVWASTKKGKKIPLHRTLLLKYYKGSRNDPWAPVRPLRGRIVHRNEFLTCTKCNKERRFILATKEDCRIHHDATLNKNWTCADFRHGNITCNDEEERKTKMRLKGCPNRSLCRGCGFCVCCGCEMCRFEDCSCQLCVDFIRNAGPVEPVVVKRTTRKKKSIK